VSGGQEDAVRSTFITPCHCAKRHVDDLGRGAEAGGVDRHVEAAEARDHGLHGLLDGVLVRHVGLHANAASPSKSAKHVPAPDHDDNRDTRALSISGAPPQRRCPKAPPVTSATCPVKRFIPVTTCIRIADGVSAAPARSIATPASPCFADLLDLDQHHRPHELVVGCTQLDITEIVLVFSPAIAARTAAMSVDLALMIAACRISKAWKVSASDNRAAACSALRRP